MLLDITGRGGNMPITRDVNTINQEINSLKQYWSTRLTKFKEWYDILLLIDALYTRGMESYVSNEPQTFYNMAHYLLTKGDLSHTIPIETESAYDLDKRARVDRGCRYMWDLADRDRKLAGISPFIDDFGFFALVLGWYSISVYYDREKGIPVVNVWNPADTFPNFTGTVMSSCVHSYKITESAAAIKAEQLGWNYQTMQGRTPSLTTEVTIDEFFFNDGELKSVVLIGGQDVTGIQSRSDMLVLCSPIGGFQDRGTLTNSSMNWRQLAGRSIFEVNREVFTSFNKWKSIATQVLKDTVNPITQEFSATPKATPEQIRERGALFNYAPGEAGLQRVSNPPIPLELQAHLVETRREVQKGSFNDAVYGMTEGQAGYALSLLSSSSANQILYPYMDAKHFVISEIDRFWLLNLKQGGRIFAIKGTTLEQLKGDEIPEDVSVNVNSEVATPKDWMERGTIAGMLKDHLDESTIVTEILHMPDPQGIKRKRSVDRMLNHPLSQLVEQISGYYIHAEYLKSRGDKKQAELFIRAAQALETQLGAAPEGQPNPAEATGVMAARKAGAPAEKQTVSSMVAPPEARQGFSPQQLRTMVGKGKIRR
jgi:hypothetical protein